MKRCVMYIGVVSMCILFGVTACGGSLNASENENEELQKVGQMQEEEENEDNILIAGVVSEASDTAYKIKLMGFGTNEMERFLLADRREMEFAEGDDVIITLNSKMHLVDEEGTSQEFNTVDRYAEFIKGKSELFYMADVKKITAFENDGIFTGKVTGIHTIYDENSEYPVDTVITITPNEDETESGFFVVSVEVAGYNNAIGDLFEVTYDKTSLEVLSAEKK